MANSTCKSRQNETDAVELQRAAIAGEIHDSLIPYLFATRMRLESLLENLRGSSDATKTKPAMAELACTELACTELAKAIETLHTASTISRQLTGELYPADLDNESWSDHLIAAFDRNGAVPGTRLTFDGDFDALHFNPDCQIAARRIAQESIRNAVRHGRATNVHVSVKTLDESQVQLTINDDGRGFDTTSSKLGYGLRIMESRASLVDASFTAESKLGGPTTVTAIFQRYDAAAAD